MTIQLLSEETINQIAAGEVIENPASVVKELVENAIDAGASHISVEVKAGGQKLIRVVDDGSGMDRENAIRSLERFATSKIRNAEDLFKLSTMGFRGEALASIAAVSKMRLHTSLGERGTSIEVEAGKIREVALLPRTRGTTIEVHTLFYNVPARKKFQKSASANAAEITRMLTQLSLAHPSIGFSLVQNETELFSMPPPRPGHEPLFVRVRQLLGEEFIQGASEVKMKTDSFELTGLLGDPMRSRMNRSGQFLFINQRPVISSLLSYAIKDGYGTRLDSNRHPIYLLHFNIPPDRVDVNVHPQKREVRLKDEKWVRDQVQDAVSEALKKHERPMSQEVLSFPASPFSFTSSEPFSTSSSPLLFKEEQEKEEPILEMPEKPHIQVVGLFSPFLLLEESSLEHKNELLLVDLLAASERLLYDAWIKQMGQNSPSQQLLFPQTVALTAPDAALLEAHIEEFEKIGISIRLAGKERVIIDALPPFLIEFELNDLISTLIHELSSCQGDLLQKRQQKLALAACRFGRANKSSFLLQEALGIYEELMKSSSPHHSPHGKPITLTLSRYEIFELFSRKKSH